MTDRLDISIGATVPEVRGPDLWAGRGLLRSEAGFRSGSCDFDRMLERLHTIFAEVGHPSAATDNPREAAADLSRHYHAMTGRDRPDADESAGELAASIHLGLIGTLASLTDHRGQSMLRLLG